MPMSDGRELRYLLAFALSSCVAHDDRGTPLYPSGGSPRSRGEVARLVGPVRVIDHQPVTTDGSSFELLPGCHVVEIGGSVGHVDPQHGGVVASLPALVYAFRMRGGGTYTIEFEVSPALGFGPTSAGSIVARERDARGRVSVVPAVRSHAEIDACRRWAALTR